MVLLQMMHMSSLLTIMRGSIRQDQLNGIEVMFITFHFHRDVKLWWRDFVVFKLARSPLLTWTQFYFITLEMDIPHTLRYRADDLTSTKQGSSYLQLLREDKRIHKLFKGLDVGFKLSLLVMVSFRKTFHKVVKFFKIIKGVKQGRYAKTTRRRPKIVVVIVDFF